MLQFQLKDPHSFEMWETPRTHLPFGHKLKLWQTGVTLSRMIRWPLQCMLPWCLEASETPQNHIVVTNQILCAVLLAPTNCITGVVKTPQSKPQNPPPGLQVGLNLFQRNCFLCRNFGVFCFFDSVFFFFLPLHSFVQRVTQRFKWRQLRAN